MKEFVNTSHDKGLFKTFIPFDSPDGAVIIEKEVGGKKRKYLHGVASNTKVDKEDERVTQNFIAKMKSMAMGLTVFAEHEHTIDKTLGFIEDVGGDSDNFEALTALEPEYDPEKNLTGNETVTKVLSKLNHGVRLGYSIGGRVTKVRKVYDEDMKKEINELEDGELYEVTVTAMPAGNGTFISPIMKSMKEIMDDEPTETAEEKIETVEPVIDTEKASILIKAWSATSDSDQKKHLEEHCKNLKLTNKQMDQLSKWYLEGKMNKNNIQKMIEAFQTINQFGEDIDKPHMSKALDEMIEASNINDQIWDFFWAFKDSVYTIIHSNDVESTDKKTKIMNLAEEFSDKIESLSSKLADLITTIDDQLN